MNKPVDELILELETLVKAIESGESGLEESIQKYEQGLVLAKNIHKRLNQLENKLVLLNPDTKT